MPLGKHICRSRVGGVRSSSGFGSPVYLLLKLVTVSQSPFRSSPCSSLFVWLYLSLNRQNSCCCCREQRSPCFTLTEFIFNLRQRQTFFVCETNLSVFTHGVFNTWFMLKFTKCPNVPDLFTCKQAVAGLNTARLNIIIKL